MFTKASQIFRAMAELLDGGSWCQGAMARDKNGMSIEYEGHDGKYPGAESWCIVGALDEAAGDSALYMYARNILSENFIGGIANFNDAPGRTAQEVISRLNDIATGLELRNQ